MNKTLSCAKTISKSLGEDHTELLEENNLHSIFLPIYTLKKVPLHDQNRIICYIIYAYDPESGWLDLKKDRLVNKMNILENLGASNKGVFEEIIDNSNQIVVMCSINFLESLKDWRWRMIYDWLDYASKMQLLATQETEKELRYKKKNKDGNFVEHIDELDIETILDASKKKGMLLDMAGEKRKKADELLREIQKDYVSTDAATQIDFGFQLTALSKVNKSLEWRQWIRKRNKEKVA